MIDVPRFSPWLPFWERKSPVEAPERAGHDVGQPERQDAVDRGEPPEGGDHGDHGDEEQQGREVAQAELLRDQVADRGAGGEGDEDREPVEGLAAERPDRVHRQRPLDQPPDEEHQRRAA